SALGVALAAGEEKRLGEKPTQNLAAYDAFLKGEAASDSLGANDSTTLKRALLFYEQAVALDPTFAEAWARISVASSLIYYDGIARPEIKERALLGSQKAIALAPGRPEGFVAAGDYDQLVLLDFAGALDQYARGQRIAPDDVDLLTGIALAEE